MAVVIRFNTLIVRKASIGDKYPGGLGDYRELYLPRQAGFYYEDRHLIAHISMSAFYGVYDRLRAGGLIGYQRGTFVDYYDGTQATGVDPRCNWLENRIVDGLPVCWIRTDVPGHVVDFKDSRFLSRVGGETCALCGSRLGAAAAVMAIHIRERDEGPLAFVDASRDNQDQRFVVRCLICGSEAVFDEFGSLLGSYKQHL